MKAPRKPGKSRTQNFETQECHAHRKSSCGKSRTSRMQSSSASNHPSPFWEAVHYPPITASPQRCLPRPCPCRPGDSFLGWPPCPPPPHFPMKSDAGACPHPAPAPRDAAVRALHAAGGGRPGPEALHRRGRDGVRPAGSYPTTTPPPRPEAANTAGTYRANSQRHWHPPKY